MARPTKLNPDSQEEIVRLIRAGNVAELAAEATGIGERTFYDWMARGEKGDELYAEFREAVLLAKAEAEAGLVARIAQAATNGSWQASAWLLERRFGERWAKQPTVKKSGRPDKKDLESKDPIEQARDELAKRRERRAVGA